MLPNPYSPGGVPRHLAGRDADLQAVRDYLEPVVAYGEMAGPPLVMHGRRGIGKTSTMRYAADMARELGFVVAWTACRGGEPFLADIADRTAEALRRADLVSRDDRRAAAAVDRVGIEVSVPAIARLSAEIRRRRSPEPHLSPPQGAVSAVEDLLHQAAVLAAGDEHRLGVGLLVAIDELHAGHPGEMAVLLNAIQNLNGERQENPLAVVGAGLPSVRGLLTEAATFGERSRWHSLSEFSDSALSEALVVPAARLGVEWVPDAVDAVLDAAQRYPHFLHIMGECTWLSARPEHGDTLTVADARAGIERGRTELEDLYNARWSAATPKERQVLVAIAALGGDQPVPRREIERAVGGDIGKARTGLLQKAVVEDLEAGRLGFTLPGFARFVLDQEAA
jgi:hypothetical protein